MFILGQIKTNGIDGFLGTRASIMLDVVFLAMFAVVPLLWYSIQLAKKRKFQAHKRMQLALATVLLVAVLAFELDMHYLTDWKLRAAPSPFFDPVQMWSSPVGISLLVHLTFAVPTLFLWIFVITQALRLFPKPAMPGSHSATHLFLGKLAGIGMFMTSLTGWVFYYLAFVAG